VRAKRVRALRRFEAMLASATGAEPSKLSFRRIKRAHLEARRLGFVPVSHPVVEVAGEAVRL
jgi:hypothetical protein